MTACYEVQTLTRTQDTTQDDTNTNDTPKFKNYRTQTRIHIIKILKKKIHYYIISFI